MILPRRAALCLGAGALAWGLAPPAGRAAAAVDIEMRGRKDGSRVWFDPLGLWIAPGTTVRWTNRNPGNAHTATAYHHDIGGRQRRIPVGAPAWDSGYLLPGENFAVALEVPGVYDYYCLPHEHAGMVGRIVVGEDAKSNLGPTGDYEPPPEAALAAFPTIAEIELHRLVHAPD
jgi:plastocyanin